MCCLLPLTWPDVSSAAPASVGSSQEVGEQDHGSPSSWPLGCQVLVGGNRRTYTVGQNVCISCQIIIHIFTQNKTLRLCKKTSIMKTSYFVVNTDTDNLGRDK